MKKSRVFEIAYVGLKDGEHLYEYEIDDRFLKDMGYAEDEISNLNCLVKLRFDKQNGFFQLHFDLDGKAEVVCDRCGDPMVLQIWDEYKLIVKISYTDEPVERNEDDEVIFIPKSETVLDVSEWIYEFLILSVPIQHVHPNDERGNSTCNPEALKMLEQLNQEQEEKRNREIWKGLENLRNKKK